MVGMMLLTSGCSLTGGSDPVQYYVLTSQAELGDAASSATEFSVGVGPVSLPDYLHRPQLVTRLSDTELQIDDFSRWAEPIEAGFMRLLRENLSVALGASVQEYPWYSTRAPTLAVSVDVVRFELTAAGTAVLICRWEISRAATRERLFTKQSVITEPADSVVSVSVAALSRVMDQLSREIVVELRRVGMGTEN
jgi:uncharacterized lipoprotein YmbA